MRTQGGINSFKRFLCLIGAICCARTGSAPHGTGGQSGNALGGQSTAGAVGTGGTVADAAFSDSSVADTASFGDSSAADTASFGDSSAGDTASAVTVTPIAAAVTHACAVVGGAAYCWGANEFGQLGNGSTTDSSLPVQVQGLTAGVQAVAAGSRLSCAIADGTVYCWGDTGVVASAGSVVPLQVQGLGFGVLAITAGVNDAYAIVDGAVYGWGGDFNFDAAPIDGPPNSGIQALAAGACAIVSGAAYCRGLNNYGEVGDGTRNKTTVLVQVQGLTSGVTAVAAGWTHACAAMNGAVFCWGNNTSGQLGNDPRTGTWSYTPSLPTSPCSLVPLQVLGLPAGAVEAITAGTYHTCAVVDGIAYCWGGNSFGQLGDGSTTATHQPVQVKGLTGVTAISANGYPDPNYYDMTCAVANGGVYCWGSNAYGQLGNGTTTDSSVPVQVRFF